MTSFIGERASAFKTGVSGTDGNLDGNEAEDFRDEIERLEAEQAAFLASLEAESNVVLGPETWFDHSAWATINRDPEINERAGNARGYYLDRYRETLDRYAELSATRERQGEPAAPGMLMIAEAHPDAPVGAAAAAEIDLMNIYQQAAFDSAVSGIFCLSHKHPDKEHGKGKFFVQHFKPEHMQTMALEARSRSTNENVYFDPNLRRPDLGKGRGKLEDISVALSLVAEEDADQGKFVTLPPGITPTAIVETSYGPAGSNRHFHFVYDRALSPQEAKKLAALAYRKMGGDTGSKDIAHCWRIPGTLNHPDWHKIQRGRSSAPQEVKTIAGSGERVNVDALIAALEAMPDLHPRPEPTTKPQGLAQRGNGRDYTRDGAHDGDRARILKRLRPVLRAEIDLEPAVGLRSEYCGSIMFKLFRAGLTPDEVLTVATGSAFARKYGERGDLEAEIARAWSGWEAREKGKTGRTEAKDAKEPTPGVPAFSETAIAECLIKAHRDDLRYVAELAQWLLWDGSCWKPDRKGYAFSRARKFCLEAAKEVLEEAEAAAKKAQAAGENKKPSMAGPKKLARELTSAKTRAAVDRLAKGDGRLTILPEELDSDPWLLNTPDGVIDLKTSRMREHRASDFMTQMTSVSPDANCPTPIWNAFLKRVTGDNAGKITYLQRMSGYFCTGDISKESLWFLFGPGGNGKGVYTTTLARILLDYHCTAPIEILLESLYERHPADLARLRGKRLVTFNETDEGKNWSEAKLKGYTGGDPIPCRHMRQNPFEFLPQFKPLISGNHKPALRSVNEAIKRRFKLVPFDVVIPEDERDEGLKDKLRAEYPGILAWMIQGCFDMLKDGFDAPADVTEATEDYLSNEDALANWLDERCDLDLLGFEASEDLFDDWRQWAARNGVHSNIGSKALIQKLLERRQWDLKRHQEKTGARRRGLMGLSFKPDVKDGREEERKAKMGAKERAKAYYKPEDDKAKA